MSRLVLIAALAALTLTGCKTTGTATEVRYQTVTVTKRGPCPEPKVYEALKASRPTPLRNQVKPSTGTERVARTSAQLGLYEREGGWADRVSAALARCQIAEESQGVEASP